MNKEQFTKEYNSNNQSGKYSKDKHLIIHYKNIYNEVPKIC